MHQGCVHAGRKHDDLPFWITNIHERVAETINEFCMIEVPMSRVMNAGVVETPQVGVGSMGTIASPTVLNKQEWRSKRHDAHSANMCPMFIR